jgi:hypothetical protein
MLWLHRTFRLLRLYFVVEIIFGVWGLIWGSVFVAKVIDEKTAVGAAILCGFFTSMPVWNYLSRPSLGISSVEAYSSNEVVLISMVAKQAETDIQLAQSSTTQSENVLMPLNAVS